MTGPELIKIAKELNLPNDQYLIVGSGPMVVRNIREGADIDIVAKPELLEKLMNEYPTKEDNGKKVIELRPDVDITANGIFQDGSVLSLTEMFEKANLIEDIPFLNLEQLIIFKQKLNREKDQKDIELIKLYLTEHQNPQ